MRNKRSIYEQKIVAWAKESEDGFEALFDKYEPLYLKFFREFYVPGMDLDDWKQEAAIVLMKSLEKYDPSKINTFGSFYKVNLRNHLYDMLRKLRAQKRVPSDKLSSLNKFQDYYAETIQDHLAVNPERCSVIYDNLQYVLERCSKFESQVLLRSFWELPFKDKNSRKFRGALCRCKHKFEEQDVR